MSKKGRIESDSLGEIEVPHGTLWGAQTQRALLHFTASVEPIPRELISAFAYLKKAAAIVNCRDGRLPQEKATLICRACDALLAGEHRDAFPLGVWMTGSGTQFNMNVNEVIGNLCSQYIGEPLGSKRPVHPNDDINMSQSSNDTFPAAMHIATAVDMSRKVLPALQALAQALDAKVSGWESIVKIGRTHMQDATPLTLGQEFSGYVKMLEEDIARLTSAMEDVYRLAIGGTAVGTGINAQPGFDSAVTEELVALTSLPFVPAANKFAVMGAHDALVHLSATLKTTAVSLYKIANDIRLLSSGPRAGINELTLPANEPGSSIMPGKVNPTQCEALAMVAIQVMANDFAVAMAGAGGHLEMNVYKTVMIDNIMRSIRTLGDCCNNFRKYLVEGMEANEEQIAAHLEQSLMLVTALSPVIGYEKAARVAHHAHTHNSTLREAALALGYVAAEEYDRIVDPTKMVHPYVAEI